MIDMTDIKLTEAQIKEIETQIDALTLGKVKNRRVYYKMTSWKPDYEVVCEHVFNEHGICIANVVFDEEGKVHIEPILVDDMLMEDNYPHPKINKK